MSKASEWAAKVAAAKNVVPEFGFGHRMNIADVTEDGQCRVGWHEPIPPQAALELARWILDVFGEAEPSPPVEGASQ